MSKLDFTNYSQSSSFSFGDNDTNNNFHFHKTHNKLSSSGGEMKYNLELKNGKLKTFSVNLSDSPGQVLLSLANALKECGISGIPSPPLTSTQTTSNDQSVSWKRQIMKKQTWNTNSGFHANELNRLYGILWSASSQSNKFQNGNPKEIDHQFNVHSNRGRDLQHFLTNVMDTEEILRKKQNRMDAMAVALLARECYQFQAIDGVTKMRWSSTSFTKALKSLLVCHEEHFRKFNVKSFYPLRLVWSNDEFQHKLDLYGGTLSINPAATQSQWLEESLLTVTPSELEKLALNQKLLKRNISIIQKHFRIKISKGHSCTSREYHSLLHNLAHSILLNSSERCDNQHENHSIILSDQARVVIETKQAMSRRGKVTKTGNIQVSAGMNYESLSKSISSLRKKALEVTEEQHQLKLKYLQLKDLCRQEIGITQINYKPHLSTVKLHEASQCLSRLLLEESREIFGKFLTGKTLNITSSGQFCHLGDDGSLMIPWDWR